MAVAQLNKKILENFRPRLKKGLSAVNDECALYDIVPEIQDYFNSSRFFMSETLAFLESQGHSEEIIQFRQDVSEATQRMEAIAQRHFITHLKNFETDADKIRFIQAFGHPDTDFSCPILNFERLPELREERRISDIGKGSTVLILGTGSVSLTGLYFASHGAKVILIDRDPRAIDTFRVLQEYLPAALQDNISLPAPCDARELDYPTDVTHIFMAALLQPKEPIVDKIAQTYRDREENVTLLVRIPRRDLMQLFYFDVAADSLKPFDVIGTVDLGPEIQPAVTRVLRLRK